jgi:hypothetical protein
MAQTSMVELHLGSVLREERRGQPLWLVSATDATPYSNLANAFA